MLGVTVLLMGDGELSRLQVLRDLDQRRLTTAAAGQLLGLERRQVFRLLKAFRIEGPIGLISKRRGRPCRTARSRNCSWRGRQASWFCSRGRDQG